MKKLKSLTALLIAVSILLLSGCSDIKAMFSKPDSDLYAITALSEKATNFSSVDVMGNYALFLASKELDPYELFVFDVEKNKIAQEKSLADCSLECITDAKFTGENEITVYDEENTKCIKYDLNLNEIGQSDFTPADYDLYDSSEEADFINYRFAKHDTYAYAYEGDNMYIVYADDVNTFYVCDGSGELLSANGKKVLINNSVYSESDETTKSTLVVYDLENSKSINEAALETTQAGQYLNVYDSAFNDSYVCFIKCTGNDVTGGQKVEPYIWKYAENAKNEDINVRKLRTSEFEDVNNTLIAEMKEKYSIDFYVNKPTEWGTYNDVTEFNASPLQVNLVLQGLKDSLALFPEGFIKEIVDVPNVEKLNIYICSSIENVNAYADDFTETYEIMFSFNGFTKGIVFHELMHLIDNRLQNHYDEVNKDFYAEWEELNPKGYEYSGSDDGECDENYFVSNYATTNAVEDLADTFEAMYEVSVNKDYERLTQHEGVFKKAKFLADAIRESYSCMKNAQNVCWEEFIEMADTAE